MAEQTVDKLVIDIQVKGNAPREIEKVKKGVEDLDKKNSKKGGMAGGGSLSSLSLLAGKLAIVGYALRGVSKTFSNFIKESTSYTENLNLFRVTFGKLSDEAERFSETFSNSLGLDISQVMRNMGFFNQIATGFGLVEDKAFEMSKTLTQISYDISSFFDISIEDSISKVQSGLAGELEPLRRIGYALDQATLQQVAYSIGINKSIRSMTQAEKAQIRTLAIFQQSKNIMGDLAGTIQSPANQIRILQQQFTLLARSIGNTIIPVLTKVLPVINGVVQGLTQVFNGLAKTFGFGIDEGVRDTANEIDGIASSIEDVEDATRKMLLPFDSFNALTKNDNDNNLGSSFNIEIPTYDALLGLNQINDKIKEISSNIFTFIEPLIGGITSVIDIMKTGMTDIDFSEVLTPIRDIVVTILPIVAQLAVLFLDIMKSLMPILSVSLSAISELVTVAKPAISSIVNILILLVRNIITPILNFISGIFSFVSGIFDFSGLFSGFAFNSIPMPSYATGGFTPEVTGSLFQAGENGRPELMGSVKGKNAVANVQSIEGAMESASYRGMTRALMDTSSQSSTQRDIVLGIDGQELARATVKNIANSLSKNYRIEFNPR